MCSSFFVHHLERVPCHNDLQPRNLIFLGDSFKAIDYEEASQGDPYYDIATVANGFCYQPEHELVLLKTYLGRAPSELELAKLYCMKRVAWIFWALAFLKMVPEQLSQYARTTVPSFIDFMRQMGSGAINLDNPEHKLKFAKVLINRAIVDRESQEFRDATNMLSKN
jgi:thiamine kinase-like enzyme